MLDIADLSQLDCELLNAYQHDFPLVSNPYAAIAAELGVEEAAVMESLNRLQAAGAISRIGAVVAPHKAGWSTLAALKVPAEDFEKVAAIVSGFDEVNHNYEREHMFNLWFVVTASSVEGVKKVLADIERQTGLSVLDLPLEKAYHIDLGFALKWH